MLTVGSLFSGVGLLDYGLHQAGIHHAWLCERDEWRRTILAKRWPGARVLDDVRHAGHGCEPVDLIAGGFPCKGASSAGKQEGFGHPETVLWREMRRAIGELRARYVLVENVANILALHDGAVWGEVLGDLAALGYGVVWDCLPAAAVGAPHLRDRVFAVAVANADQPRTDAHAAAGGSRSATRERGRGAAADADGTGWALGRQPEHPEPPRVGDLAHEDAAVAGEAASDAASAGLEGRGLRGLPPERGQAAPDTGRERRQQVARGAHGDEAPALREGRIGADADHEPAGAVEGRVPATRGVAVEWGDYQPAIERWERVQGPAPEPLVRRVDDRSAARVERSRLSALGDGVQVQVGRIAGEYILELERRRLADAA